MHVKKPKKSDHILMCESLRQFCKETTHALHHIKLNVMPAFSFVQKKGEQPTGQQRRKHQITYLIHQVSASKAQIIIILIKQYISSSAHVSEGPWGTSVQTYI